MCIAERVEFERNEDRDGGWAREILCESGKNDQTEAPSLLVPNTSTTTTAATTSTTTSTTAPSPAITRGRAAAFDFEATIRTFEACRGLGAEFGC